MKKTQEKSQRQICLDIFEQNKDTFVSLSVFKDAVGKNAVKRISDIRKKYHIYKKREGNDILYCMTEKRIIPLSTEPREVSFLKKIINKIKKLGKKFLSK